MKILVSQRLTDFTIWNFAKTNNYSILTFDEDFSELQNLYSYPPKIIWLRTGNIGTAEIANLLVKQKKGIDNFLANQDLGLYEICL
jgi:predicted nuclease of predicted toxin-antitoxin system